MIGPTSDQAKARLGPVNAHLSTVSFCILSFETEQLRLPWPSAVELELLVAVSNLGIV